MFSGAETWVETKAGSLLRSRGTWKYTTPPLTDGTWECAYTPGSALKSKTNLATGATTSYSYDHFGNLRKVVLPNGRVIEYVIDGQNRRIGKKIDGVLVQAWLYGGQRGIAAELDGTGQVVSRFVSGVQGRRGK